MEDPRLILEVATPLAFRVRLTQLVWQEIVSRKHPELLGHEEDVRRCLSEPEEIRESTRRPGAMLFYRTIRQQRYVCVVAKATGEEIAYVSSAYMTDKIKAGRILWTP